MTTPEQACLVNCGLHGGQCACYRANNPSTLYNHTPHQDLRFTPDTITLPRAEVEALDRVLTKCCDNSYSTAQEAYLSLRASLAAIQEHLK